MIGPLSRSGPVLRAFTPDTPTLSVSEAATAAGVTRATARRMLLTLTELGYAVQDGRRFALTPPSAG